MQNINFTKQTILYWLLTIISTILIFSANLSYPLIIAIPTLYIIPIWLTLWLPKTKYIIFFAIISIILILIEYFLFQPFHMYMEFIVNRLISILAIGFNTMMVVFRKIAITNLTTIKKEQQAILDTAIDPIITLDENHTIQSASKSLKTTFGWEPNNIIGQKFHNLLAEPFAKQYSNYLTDLSSLSIDSAFTTKAELLAKHKDNTIFACEISIAKITKANNSHFFSISLRDVGERKLFEEKLLWLSMHDELTGIFNRRYFNKQINIEWQRLIRTESPLAVIMLDIDDFKLYNDTLGHQEGDRCLKIIANILSKATHRVADIVARYGGEEFIILLPNTTTSGLISIADKIQTGIRNLQLQRPQTGILDFVSVSMGLAVMVPTNFCNTDVLIKQADHALYQAKHSGKNCYKLYSKE